MPSHQERRKPLPKGYQFGDAASDDVKALKSAPTSTSTLTDWFMDPEPEVMAIALRQRIFGASSWAVEFIDGEPKLVRIAGANK